MRTLLVAGFLTVYAGMSFSTVRAGTTLDLEWDQNAETNIVKYRLYWGTASGRYDQMVDVQGATRATARALKPQQDYYFVVTALNDAGLESDVSNEVAARTMNDSPAVDITSPKPMAVFTAGEPINIYASAVDQDGRVMKVVFYAGASPIFESSTIPFSGTWNNVAPGDYTLTAVATDDLGAQTTSAPVSIRVSARPTVTLTSPATGALLSGTVSPNGLATTAYFEYGLTTAYGNTAPVTLSPADGIGAQSVSVSLNGVQPGTTYYYRLVASNSLGTSTTGTGTFTTPQMTKADWRQRYFNTTLGSGAAADMADPDGDGQVNLLEFAFGTDPTLVQSNVVSFSGSGNETIITPGRETVSLTTTSTSVNYRARFGRRKNYASEGLAYTVQFSADFSSWANSTATPAVMADDGTLQVVEVPYPFFVNGRKTRFFRVSVTGP